MLQSDDGHVLESCFAALLKQIVVDLSAAHHDSVHVLLIDVVDLAEDGPETPVSKFLERGHRQPMPQQTLRREGDQRLAQRPNDLPTEHVEDLRGRGRQTDLDIVLRRQLQVALEARRRVLGALAFVAVRQQHDQTAHARPLGFAADDKLVDHDLRAVGEVAELRFPDH